MPSETTTRTEAVTSRMTDAEALRIGLAARIRGTSRSSYIRRAAVQAAERDLDRLGEQPEADDRCSRDGARRKAEAVR